MDNNPALVAEIEDNAMYLKVDIRNFEGDVPENWNISGIPTLIAGTVDTSSDGRENEFHPYQIEDARIQGFTTDLSDLIDTLSE